MVNNRDQQIFHHHAFWYYMGLMAMGVWQIATPLSFSTASYILRNNDLFCGALLLILSFFCLRGWHHSAPWIALGVGIWLQIAPLVFWAPEAVVYFNDTLVGAFVVLFAIVLPGTQESVLDGCELPPGWSYNPSSRLQRVPVVALAMICWMLARYMASYQLGYLPSIWDPIFGDGTHNVVTSDISKAFPVSDAGLGALVYTLEALLGCKGSERRWYTMPWLVLLFAIMVVPAGLVSVILIILQPTLVGSWCFWCLMTAVCMLCMITFAVDEMVAVLQYLARVRREGLPFWKIFWKGGCDASEGRDFRQCEVNEGIQRLASAMGWGISISRNLFVCAALGLATMFTPTLLGLCGLAQHSANIAGALIVTFSIISMAEVIRTLRLVNVILAAWLILAPWILPGYTLHAQGVHVVFGIAIAVLALPRGVIRETYGSWQRNIR